MTEKIEEFYFDGIEKTTKYYEIEPNLKNNKNLFVTIVGLIVTITITIIQAFLDGNSSLFISLYVSILAFVIYLILKTTNTIQEQSYFDKLKIAYRGILRKFYWKFSKNYCEVCLKKCPNEKKQIIYLLQKEIDQIEIVRFGHDSCISPCFSYYKGSNGAFSPYQITELNLTDLKIKLDGFNKYSEPVKLKLKILSKNII